MQLRTVRIWGFSKDPIEVQTSASTALQVAESVGRQVPELKPDPFLGPKHIEIVGHRTIEDLAAPLEADVINIVPAFAGAKGGLGQILLGGVLIALSFVPGLQFLAPYALKIGALLVLGGLVQLLSPAPDVNKNDQTKSRYLGPPTNTTAIGTTIPVLYGRRKIGGHLLSVDIAATLVRPYGT